MSTGFSFLHIGLNCNDPLAIERFYTQHFGFQRDRVYAPGDGQVVVIKSGTLCLELFKAEGKPPFESPGKDGPTWQGLRHFAFLVDNLDDKLAELGDAVKLTLGPIDFSSFIANHRTAWVSDPEGNIIELNQGYKTEEKPPALPAQ